MRKCAYCGKRHWFWISPRHWLFYLRHRGRYLSRVERVDGRLVGTGITNYHKSAGQIFCHGCWAPYLREIGE